MRYRHVHYDTLQRDDCNVWLSCKSFVDFATVRDRVSASRASSFPRLLRIVRRELYEGQLLNGLSGMNRLCALVSKPYVSILCICLQLLEEMLDNGYPLTTEPNALKAMVAPPSTANRIAAMVSVSELANALNELCQHLTPRLLVLHL